MEILALLAAATKAKDDDSEDECLGWAGPIAREWPPQVPCGPVRGLSSYPNASCCRNTRLCNVFIHFWKGLAERGSGWQWLWSTGSSPGEDPALPECSSRSPHVESMSPNVYASCTALELVSLPLPSDVASESALSDCSEPLAELGAKGFEEGGLGSALAAFIMCGEGTKEINENPKTASAPTITPKGAGPASQVKACSVRYLA
ncbi:hypothetical protein VTG60DRAFT_7213 [Thermothelomyces hinnuleus]